MRVIAGTAKGHLIKAPRGTPTRPATDLVRGAVFSILENTARGWERVLDLFSGSGAMGIEALSRGAGWVDLVDREPRCCAIIKQNLEKTGLSDYAHVYCCEVLKAIRFLDKEYNIVIMDPPYSDKSIGTVITELASSSLINDKSTVIVTHSPHLPLAADYAGLHMTKEKRHGDSCISIYHREREATS